MKPGPALLRAELRSGRDIGLEEAAQVAEQYDRYAVDGKPSVGGTVIATAIRHLKSSEQGPQSGQDLDQPLGGHCGQS